MTDAEQFRKSIEQGLPDDVERLLKKHPGFANTRIKWELNQENESDPLHYVSDCVFNGWLTNGTEGEIARLLLDNGAEVNGSAGAESPLIGAASLSAARVADVLLDAGADIHRTAVLGANALHWASWVGLPRLAQRLLEHGAELEKKCQEYEGTPLFWMVQASSKYGTGKKTDLPGTAKVLLEAGADIYTRNYQGVTALERSRESDSMDMYNLLREYAST